MSLTRFSTSCRRFKLPSMSVLPLVVCLLLALTTGMASAQVAPTTPLSVQLYSATGISSSVLFVRSDAVLHTPQGDFQGSDGLTQFESALGPSLTNITFSVNSAETQGSLHVIRFMLTAINAESFQGLAANCIRISVPAVAVLRITDNQVVEQWIDYDTTSIASQIEVYNQHDVHGRSGCGDSSLPAQESDPGNALPPVCEPRGKAC